MTAVAVLWDVTVDLILAADEVALKEAGTKGFPTSLWLK